MPTVKETLEYLDPNFAKAPEEVKQKIADFLKSDPRRLDEALSYLDPKYAEAPKKVKGLILKSLVDVPFYEKFGRALAYGSGEFVEDLGQIVKGGAKLLEKGAELITGKDYDFTTPIENTLIQYGQDAKEYWRPEKYSEVYDFTGSGIVEEIPSLIGFAPAIGVGGKLGSAVAKKVLKREGLTKAVGENVGAGLGYSATQVAAGDYTGEDVARDVVLDTALGAGGYQLGRLLKRILEEVKIGKKTPEEAIEEIKALEGLKQEIKALPPPRVKGELPKPDAIFVYPKEVEVKAKKPKEVNVEGGIDKGEPPFLDETPVLKQKDVLTYRPFPMMGNKAQLLQKKGYIALFKEGVEGSNRVIDAFMGTGLNSNIIEKITDKPLPIIKNEFNPFRYRVYKELHENPEKLIAGVKRHIEYIDKSITPKLNQDKRKEAKKQLEAYLKTNIEKDPSAYIVAQHLTPSSKPINTTNDVVVDLRGDLKIRGWKALKSGEVEKRLVKTAKVLRKYPHEIRQGDAWELVKKAKEGDFVIFDPDYIREGGRKVAGYGATTEDKELKSFLEKFDRIVLPKAGQGVRFLITNTWDDGLAKALRERGFLVYKVNRRSAKSVKQELVAVNYRAGEITTGGVGGGKEVRSSYDLPDEGRGLGEAGQGRIGREGQLFPHGDATLPEGEVGRAGDSRISEEIRDSGRGGRGLGETRFYSGGPSFEQIKAGIVKLIKESEDPLAKTESYGELDPFTRLARADRQAAFANWVRWVLPQYEWLKKSPRTAAVYRAAKEYTEGLEKDFYTWLGNRLDALKQRFKGMSDEEKERVIDVVEGRLKDADDETKGIAGEIRSYLDEFYDYANDKLYNRTLVANKLREFSRTARGVLDEEGAKELRGEIKEIRSILKQGKIDRGGLEALLSKIDSLRKSLESKGVFSKEVEQAWKDLRNTAQAAGISYREDYFPHLFEGNIRVKVGDEFVSTKTWDEALEVVAKGLEEGKEVKIRAFLRPDIYEVKITNPRFWKLVNNLEQGVELTKDEVKQLVKKAGVGNRPRYRFVGNLLQRKYNIDGYIKDPETALSLYTFTLLKKLHQDRFLKEFERAYQNVPSAKLRKLLDEYKEQVLGYPTKGEQVTADIVNSFLKTRPGRVLLRALNKSVGSELSPFQVRKAAGTSGYWANYFADLGFSASSAMVNSTQVALNVAPVLGVRSVIRGGNKYIKGLIKGDEKIKKELFDAGVLTETGFENMRASTKDYPLIMFKAVEVANRAATYGAAKDYAKRNGVEGMLKVLDVLGVSKDDPLYRKILDKKVPLEEKAIDFAREVVDKTQFRYEKFAAPRGLSGSIAKLLLPYKNFLINQVLLSARMATRNAIKHPREALQFFGAAMLIAGVSGNPILYYGYEVIDWLYREQTGKSLEDEIDNPTLKAFIKGGLPLVAGVDIRSSVKIDVPTSFRDLLGRPGRLAMALAEGDPQKIEREIKPRIYQNIEDALQMYKTGYVKDSKGRVIDKATTKDAALRALGLRPRSYYEFLEKKDKIYTLNLLFKRKYEPIVNSLADAIVNGDEGAYKELYAEITDRLKYLANKVQSSEGEVKKEYMYLYLKLSSAISREGLMRRVKNRIDPFGSDKKKKMLLQ